MLRDGRHLFKALHLVLSLRPMLWLGVFYVFHDTSAHIAVSGTITIL